MTNVVMAKHLQRFLPVATVVGAAVNLGLNLALVPRSGAVGAAWATVISYGVVCLVLTAGPRDTRPLVLLAGKTVIVPALLCATALVAALQATTSPVLRLVIAGVIYLVGLVASKSVRPADLRALGSMVLPGKPVR